MWDPVTFVSGQRQCSLIPSAADQPLDLAILLEDIDGHDRARHDGPRLRTPPAVDATPVAGGGAVEIPVIQRVDDAGMPGMAAAAWPVDHNGVFANEAIGEFPEPCIARVDRLAHASPPAFTYR